MLPGVIEMIMWIVPARIVANPLAVGMDMRRIRVAGSIPIITFFLGLRVWVSNRGRAVSGDMLVAVRLLPGAVTLGSRCNAKQQQHRQEQSDPVHVVLHEYPLRCRRRGPEHQGPAD
jgi:hypothetical protein